MDLWTCYCPARVFFPLLAVILASAGVDGAPAPVLPNDNTHPAGRLEGHRLTLSLVVATGTIAAEGPHISAREISAFSGKTASRSRRPRRSFE